MSFLAKMAKNWSWSSSLMAVALSSVSAIWTSEKPCAPQHGQTNVSPSKLPRNHRQGATFCVTH